MLDPSTNGFVSRLDFPVLSLTVLGTIQRPLALYTFAEIALAAGLVALIKII